MRLLITDMRPWPNTSLEPTWVGAFSSAIADDASWSRVAQVCRLANVSGAMTTWTSGKRGDQSVPREPAAGKCGTVASSL